MLCLWDTGTGTPELNFLLTIEQYICAKEADMPIIVQLVLLAIIGYLWGSIPAGYWMDKIIRGNDFDIRAYGSCKIGATDVLRTLGRVPALIVLVFDLIKGVAPALVAPLVTSISGDGGGPTVAGLAGLL